MSVYHDGRKIISQSRELQVDYWLKVGLHKQAIQDVQKLKSPTKLPNNINDNNILLSKTNICIPTTNNSIVIQPKTTQLILNQQKSNTETIKKFAALSNNFCAATEKKKMLNDVSLFKESSKLINGNTSSSNIINRKRSMSILQTEITASNGQQQSNKRRLSQLRGN